MTYSVDCVVVGAGVIGLAIARELCMQGKECILLEKNSRIGTETSARSSEVIHAGIYYPKGSFKSTLCIQGKALLYAYCAEKNIDFRQCGKLVVATKREHLQSLMAIEANCKNVGINDTEFLTQAEAKILEPELHCLAALRSPSSGILDTHSLMLSLQGDIEKHGGVIAFNSPFLGFERADDSFYIDVGGEQPVTIKANHLINSGGLSAHHNTETMNGYPTNQRLKLKLTKGNYFSLSGKAPFTRLIYPIPEQHGLGIHYTIDLNGYAKFGPDVEHVDSINYEVAPNRLIDFKDKIQEYWPSVQAEKLIPAYSGIRPQLLSSSKWDSKDFQIHSQHHHGIKNLVNLFGIDSPGITSSLAIGRYVSELLVPR